MFLTLSDLLYMICITANGLLGISANCFLLYMIVCRSPPQLTPYRIFLANTALTQLLYALVMLMVEPKIYSHEMRIVVVYLGPAQYLGPWVCYMLLIVMLHLAVNSFISIMLSMIFRCVAVLTLGFPTSAAYAMCFLGYFVPLTMVLGAINMEYVSDYESNDNYMNHTVKYLEHYRTVVGTRVDQACILWVTFCVTFLLVPIYAVMYLCRWKIHHTLSKPTFVQHPSTKVYIRRLVKALTVQATVPLFTVFPASISYMLTQFGMVHYHFYCYFITSCLSIATLVDPIVTIYYVSPYRRFVKRCLGWCQKSSWLKRSPSEKSSSSRRSFSKVLQVAEK